MSKTWNFVYFIHLKDIRLIKNLLIISNYSNYFNLKKNATKIFYFKYSENPKISILSNFILMI